MPQATKELREAWEDDAEAMNYLLKRGFTFSRGGCIIAPIGHDFVDKDFSAMDYLCQEWDYAWLGE